MLAKIFAFVMFFIGGVIGIDLSISSNEFSLVGILASLVFIFVSIVCLIMALKHNKIKREQILRLTPEEKRQYYLKKQSEVSKEINLENITFLVLPILFGIIFVIVAIEAKQILLLIPGVVFILVPFFMMYLERKNK